MTTTGSPANQRRTREDQCYGTSYNYSFTDGYRKTWDCTKVK